MSLNICIKKIYKWLFQNISFGHKRPFLVWSQTSGSQTSWSQKGGHKRPGHKRPGHKRHGHKRPGHKRPATTLCMIVNLTAKT